METRVADDAASSSLISLVQGSDGRTTLTFSGGNPQIAALKAGEILVLGPAAPEGHFGRVVSNDGTTAMTEPAAAGDNGQVYIVTDKTLQVVNASDGALAWRVAAGNNDTEPSPVFLTNKSVVAGTSSGLISVYAGGQLATGTCRKGRDANGSGRMR